MTQLRKMQVHYVGWGQDWLVGTLVRDRQTTLFEYSEPALTRGVEFSPIHLPLQRGTFTAFDASQAYLPGFIYDSLPDGWGLRLIDRVLRAQGVRQPDAFDRLRYLAKDAMGALRFEPAETLAHPWPDWSLADYAKEIQSFHSQSPEDVLHALAQTGGSPHGARPKVLLQYEPKTHQIYPPDNTEGEAWMFKFPAHEDPPDVCALEHIYACTAKAAGIDMPPTVVLDLGGGLHAFGIQRFDRQDDIRIPMLTMAGLLQCDFRMAGNVGYRELLQATYHLTKDKNEVLRAFRRLVFNVVFHNRDDHPKNFAYTLSKAQRWSLSPAYDLTFSSGPGGEHHLDVDGKGTGITRQNLLDFAENLDIPTSAARTVIEEVLDAIPVLFESLPSYDITKETREAVRNAVSAIT